MPETFGPHLLGRVPSPTDARDFQLGSFIEDDPLVAALKVLQASHAAKATKLWAAVATAKLLGQPTKPTPPPPSPVDTTDVVWTDAEPVLDQGDFGTCVGNGWAQWGNTLPFDDKFDEKVARAIYFESTVIDGSPDDPDAAGGGQQGSTVRSGAKAMQNRGRLTAYAFAKSVDEIRTWVRTKGPLVVGTEWTTPMFTPNADGFVSPTGEVVGGHCYALIGDLPEREAFEFLNSWGDSWADSGHFRITWRDFAKLLRKQGEACASLEIPL